MKSAHISNGLFAQSHFGRNMWSILAPLLIMTHIMMQSTHASTHIQRINITQFATPSQSTLVYGSIFFDGRRAIIGAYQNNSAAIFELDGPSWVQTAKLVPSNPTDSFGYSVALYADVAIIGTLGTARDGSAFIFEYNGTSWLQIAQLTLADGGGTDNVYFGWSVAIWNDTILVGGGNIHTGSDVFVYKRDGSSWTFKQRLNAFDGGGSISLGECLAIANNVAVVGAPASQNAFVYRYDGTDWASDARLVSGSGAPNFGREISISPSGDTIIFGDHGAGVSSAGAAHIFEYNGISWDGVTLSYSDSAANQYFGSSVSIFNDVAIVGANGHDNGLPGANSGAVYFFTKNGDEWSESGKWVNGVVSESLGITVSLYEDVAFIGGNGGYAYVYDMVSMDVFTELNGCLSANMDDSYLLVGGGNRPLWLYTHDTSTESWSFHQQIGSGFSTAAFHDEWIAAADAVETLSVYKRNASRFYNDYQSITAPITGASGLEYVSMSGDYIFGGNIYHDGVGVDSGAVYVYKRNATTDIWEYAQLLVAPDGQTNDLFGRRPVVRSTTAFIGAADTFGLPGGKAYIFELNPNTDSWEFKQKLVSDNQAGDQFGQQIDLDVVYGYAVIGAYKDNGNTGAAYIFERNSTGGWERKQKLSSSTPKTDGKYGQTVAIDGRYAIIGEPNYDSIYNTNSGRAFIYRRNDLEIWSLIQEVYPPSSNVIAHGNGYYFSWHCMAMHGTTVATGYRKLHIISDFDVNTYSPTSSPTLEPTQDPTIDPTNQPTMDPTNDPTADPTADPTNEPTVQPTHQPTAPPTVDPTMDPSRDPTVDPTRDPTRDPTDDPTIDPTVDPTVDPTMDPTDDPTEDPTIDPTMDPSMDPTVDPTIDPTDDPTIDPTIDPSIDPTTDPTVDPTVVPTTSPSDGPTASPTTAPHSLEDAIRISEQEDGSKINEIYIYCILFGVPALIIFFVFIMKSTVLKDTLLSIDRVEYVSVALYFLQVFDLYSDAMFTLQLYGYYSWAKHTDYEVTSSEINEFYFLFLFSLIFTILPYCANFVSSGRIVAMITSDPIISIYSKEWFKYNAGNYSIGVLLSGGSYFTLKVINSNFLGLPQLSAGLSAKQIERFAAHKVLYSTLMENFPQMILQFYFLWGLGLVTSIVVISLILSLFNILLSVLSTWMRRSSFAFQKEFPFTINLSIVENADGDGNGNPYRNAGRIEKLSEVLKSLARENKHHFSFEIMTFSRIEKSLYGVVIYKHAKVEDIKAFLDNNIEKAVLDAFECDEYAFSVMCIYPMDLFNLMVDETATNTKKVDYKATDHKGGSHVIEVEMKRVQSDDEDEGEGAEGNEALPQAMGGTAADFKVTRSGSEAEDEIALPESKQTETAGAQDTEFESLSVEQILLQSWNLGQYWGKFKQLGYDDHKYWKKVINNADALSQIFGATKGHQERFVDYVQQMK